MNDTYDNLLNIHAAMLRWAAANERGDAAAAEVAFNDAASVLWAVADAAREEAAERDGDPAEDYEPDISDVGFDPFLNTYTDDC